jgi:ATP-dependent Clp protease adapter protein ClpS
MGRMTQTNFSLPTITPEVDERQEISSGGHGWIVIVFDNDTNTWDEVMRILQIATGCSAEEAYIETWEIHHLGSSVVHSAGRSECERVASVIATIGIRVQVTEG